MPLADTSPPRSTTPTKASPSPPASPSTGPMTCPACKGAARDFYTLDGKAPTVGQIFRAPGQAEVLRRIAREGRAGFYEGEVAEDMIASLQRAGRHPHAGRPRRHRLRLHHAGLRHLQGRRTGRASAKRPGRDRDPAAEHPQALRPQGDGPLRHPARPYRGRGDQARLRRPQPLHRRPRPHHAAGPHAVARHRRETRRADRPQARDARTPRP